MIVPIAMGMVDLGKVRKRLARGTELTSYIQVRMDMLIVGRGQREHQLALDRWGWGRDG